MVGPLAGKVLASTIHTLEGQGMARKAKTLAPLVPIMQFAQLSRSIGGAFMVNGLVSQSRSPLM